MIKNWDLLVSGPEFAIAMMPRALNCEWERMMSIGASDAKESDYDGAPARVENGRKVIPLGWSEFHLRKVCPRLIGRLCRCRLGHRSES